MGQGNKLFPHLELTRGEKEAKSQVGPKMKPIE